LEKQMKGVPFNIWKKSITIPLPRVMEYPEFKGFILTCKRQTLTRMKGSCDSCSSKICFLHLFTPDNPVKRNNDKHSMCSRWALSILNAISPVGTKFKQLKLGPQSRRIIFEFRTC
jgi:hypothetical protein